MAGVILSLIYFKLVCFLTDSLSPASGLRNPIYFVLLTAGSTVYAECELVAWSPA